jgi:Ca2+-binding EF-hand superfamily protein
VSGTNSTALRNCPTFQNLPGTHSHRVFEDYASPTKRQIKILNKSFSQEKSGDLSKDSVMSDMPNIPYRMSSEFHNKDLSQIDANVEEKELEIEVSYPEFVL